MPDDFTVNVNLNEFLKLWGTLTGKLPGTVEAIIGDLAKLAKDLFEGTVRTWTGKPRFSISMERRGDTVIAAIGTDNDIYKFVNEGTGPRDIVPRKPGGFLVFRPMYHPRTRPNSMTSGRKWSAGALVFCKRVKDHKIAPRHFTVSTFRLVQMKVPDVTMQHVRSWIKLR